jgi:septal ring factor EnvC (AmiA/AmiB activator)
MYDHRGSNLAQLTRSLELAEQRLTQMIAQRDELSAAIIDLQEEIAQARQSLADLPRT